MFTRIVLFCLIFACAEHTENSNYEAEENQSRRRRLFLGGIFDTVSNIVVTIKDAVIMPVIRPFVGVADTITGVVGIKVVGHVVDSIDQGVTVILEGQPPGSKCTEEIINKCVALLQDCVKWAFEQRPFGDPYCGFASAECKTCEAAGCPMDQIKAELEKALKKQGLLKDDGSVIDVPEEQPPAPPVRPRPGRPEGWTRPTTTTPKPAEKRTKEDEEDSNLNKIMMAVIGVIVLLILIVVACLLTSNRRRRAPEPMIEEPHQQTRRRRQRS